MQLMRVRSRFVDKACIWTGVLSFILLSGCDLINPSDPVPAYIQIDEIIVDTVPGTGTTAQKFEEIWVYLNGSLAGAFSVPAKVPLIASGPSDLQIFPGIRVNGIRSAADFYPFYQPLEQTVSLVPAETTVLEMRTQYRSNAVVAYLEDFDGVHQLTDDYDGDPETKCVKTSDAFEGEGAGLIVLNDSASLIQVATVPFLSDIPTNGTAVYVELHYKNNVEFSVGLVGLAQGIDPALAPILVLRVQEDWNKVYVELSPALLASQLDAYQILFSAVHNPELTQSEIYLDNLKLVHIDQ